MLIWLILNLCFSLCILVLLTFFIWPRLRDFSTKETENQMKLGKLQSQIPRLEDLSERIESQAKQLISLIDEKSIQLKETIYRAQMESSHVRQERQKSLNVAKVFQDKIPHAEVIERQKQVDYLKAGKMAHQGQTKEEISQEVNLPEGELDLILKIHGKVKPQHLD